MKLAGVLGLEGAGLDLVVVEWAELGCLAAKGVGPVEEEGRRATLEHWASPAACQSCSVWEGLRLGA